MEKKQYTSKELGDMAENDIVPIELAAKAMNRPYLAAVKLLLALLVFTAMVCLGSGIIIGWMLPAKNVEFRLEPK